jgi:predicted transcriptional regulator
MSMIKEMRKTRIDRRLSQGELGELLGVSQEMISMMESGAKDMPSELAPFVRRWITTGKAPSKLELGARYRNPGK